MPDDSIFKAARNHAQADELAAELGVQWDGEPVLNDKNAQLEQAWSARAVEPLANVLWPPVGTPEFLDVWDTTSQDDLLTMIGGWSGEPPHDELLLRPTREAIDLVGSHEAETQQRPAVVAALRAAWQAAEFGEDVLSGHGGDEDDTVEDGPEFDVEPAEMQIKETKDGEFRVTCNECDFEEVRSTRDFAERSVTYHQTHGCNEE